MDMWKRIHNKLEDYDRDYNVFISEEAVVSCRQSKRAGVRVLQLAG